MTTQQDLARGFDAIARVILGNSEKLADMYLTSEPVGFKRVDSMRYSETEQVVFEESGESRLRVSITIDRKTGDVVVVDVRRAA